MPLPLVAFVAFIVLVGLVLSPVFCAVNPHLFERNPPERKLFLKMLAELAKEDWVWKFGYDGVGASILTSETATHKDSGIVVYNWHRVVLPTGEEIAFDYGTKGRLILERIQKIKKRADNTASLKARKERDFAALAAMSAAFDKMNAKELY